MDHNSFEPLYEGGFPGWPLPLFRFILGVLCVFSDFRLVICLNSASAHTLNSDFHFKKLKFSVFRLANIGHFRFPPNWETPLLYYINETDQNFPYVDKSENVSKTLTLKQLNSFSNSGLTFHRKSIFGKVNIILANSEHYHEIVGH